MKKIILLVLISLLQGHGYSQTMEQIAEKYAIATCDCFEKIDYIDNEIDFELKLAACSLLSQEDSLRVEQIGGVEEYQQVFNEQLRTYCEQTIETQIDLIRQSYIDEEKTPFSLERHSYSNAENIIGQYRFPTGDPTGSVYLFIMEDNKWVAMGFGEMQLGYWKIVKDKYLRLVPLRPEYPFLVYGRHNPNIKDTTQVVFMGEDKTDVLVHFGKLEETAKLTPLYNSGANCLDYPAKVKVENTYGEISLAHKPSWEDLEEIELYTIQNPEGYNDFVVYEYERQYRKKITRYVIDRGGLITGEGQHIVPSPLPEKKENEEDNEDYLFLTEWIPKAFQDNQFAAASVYYNLGYQQFEKEIILSSNYTYDSNQDAYVRIFTLKTIGGEALYKPDDYDNEDIVYKYDKLPNVAVSQQPYTTQKTSLIHNVCQSDYDED